MIDFPLSTLGLLDEPPRAPRPPAAPGYVARPPAPLQTEQPGLPTSLLSAPDRRKPRRLRKPGEAPPAKTAGQALARAALLAPAPKDQRAVAATERQPDPDPVEPPALPGADDGAGGQQQQLETAAAHTDAGFEHTQLEQDLSGLADQQGIFELLLPNGQTLGVVVQNSTQRTSFLLNPSDPKLGDRLRHNKMELESRLQRRIRSNVEIAVL